MNYQLKRLHQYACVIPVFGLIPAVIALASHQQNSKLKNTAKASLGLMLLWGVSYLSLGNFESVSQELYQGSVTSIYFLTCIAIMLRIYQSRSRKNSSDT